MKEKGSEWKKQQHVLERRIHLYISWEVRDSVQTLLWIYSNLLPEERVKISEEHPIIPEGVL